MEPNPLGVPSQEGTYASCMSNALNFQKVSISGHSFNEIDPWVVEFTGSGEGIPMTYQGQTLIVLPPNTDVSYAVTVEYSTNGESGPFQKSNICGFDQQYGSNNLLTMTISSEDQNDANPDCNDSVLTLTQHY